MQSLTPQQLQYIYYITHGETPETALEKVGVDKDTVSQWMDNQDFQQELMRRQQVSSVGEPARKNMGEETLNAINTLAEKTNRLNKFLYVAIVLLVLNLSVTGFLAFRMKQLSNTGNVTTEKDLPTSLQSDESKTELFDMLVEYYNAGDYSGFYDILPPLVQVQLPEGTMRQRFKQIRDVFGSIEKGAYSHYSYAGESNGKQVFLLFYPVRTEKVDKGMLVITVASDDDETYQIWGFNLNTGQQ